MTESRAHRHAEDLPAPPDRRFRLLHTPSAIRSRPSASRAIVIPETGAARAAGWGCDEDAPDYVTVARIDAFEPPRRLVFEDCRRFPKSGPFPFRADSRAEFLFAAAAEGAKLEDRPAGCSAGSVADEFLRRCEIGRLNMFAGIRRLLAATP